MSPSFTAMRQYRTDCARQASDAAPPKSIVQKLHFLPGFVAEPVARPTSAMWFKQGCHPNLTRIIPKLRITEIARGGTPQRDSG